MSKEQAKAFVLKVIEMNVDAWIKVPDHPRQRDTEGRLSKALKGHLKNLKPIHLEVAAARMPDGSLCKVDGHTRAAAWRGKFLERPPCMLRVKIHECKNEAELNEVFDQYDGELAVKGSKDYMHGALKYHGFDIHSNTLLRDGAWPSAFRTMYGNRASMKDKYVSLVGAHKSEISLLVSLKKVGASNLRSSLLGVAVGTCLVDGAAALPFWQGWIDGAGRAEDKKRDGHQLLREFARERVIESRSKPKDRATGFGNGGQSTRDYEGAMALECYLRWKSRKFNRDNLKGEKTLAAWIKENIEPKKELTREVPSARNTRPRVIILPANP